MELIGESLEPERAKKLREWLGKPEAHTLRGVIEAKQILLEENAKQSCRKSEDENSYDLKSKAEMKAARRYQTALQVLDEIANKDTQLETIKLKT